ncbi:T-complex protein 1 subunit alpha, partial [Ascosphaera pollenicola]
MEAARYTPYGPQRQQAYHIRTSVKCQPGRVCTALNRDDRPAARSQHGNGRSSLESDPSSAPQSRTSNANHRDDREFPPFASVNGAAGAGVESGHSMCDWLPNLMQDYSPNQTTTTAAATASNFATTLVPSSHDYTASATPTSATVQQSPYSHQPEFVSGPSSTYLNAASAFASSEDVYMNSLPGLSHPISSDSTVSRYTTTSPSTSSHQPSPDNFIHYKKDFRLDQSPFHSGGNFFGDLIHPVSAGSGADHLTNNAYHVPFGLDHFMDWGIDINNALDAAFITQAPAYPAPSVATANGGVAAPSN